MMSGFGAIAAYETARLFRRPFGWLVLAFGQGLLALYFLLLVVRFLENQGDLQTTGVTVEIVMRYFSVAFVSVLLLTPLLTMAAIAGDKRSNMLRFLYATPLSTSALVLGKFAGVLSLSMAHVVLLSLMPLTLLWGAPIDLGVYATNVIGLVLFSLMHNALGLMASALTRAPVAGALIALMISLLLWFAEWGTRLDPEASMIGRWSTLTRLRGFAEGLLVSADIVYFIAATISLLIITAVLVSMDRDLA